MDVHIAMRESVTPFLREDEKLQEVVGAQTHSVYLVYLGFVVFLALNRYRILAFTSQRILVLETGRWNSRKAKGVLGELPRSTRLGKPSGLYHVVRLDDGTKLRVARYFFKDIERADAEAETV
ncbi:hypothetical protein AB0J38_14860 [Streptomyces sp. NPDC050095]|uniref:hypothetical protein n=1 Tax=unclassified Streptomyces TaxID=2593676 RepID=UPI00341D7749